MDFLTSPEFITTVISGLGLVLSFVIARAAAAFTMWTGIEIEKKHRDALHMAIISGVESALKAGISEGAQTFKDHVLQHVRESVPDAIQKISPIPDVLDRIIQRYTLEALDRIGPRK